MSANPNTPEGRIEQASGFASRVTADARVSRERRSVIWVLAGVLVAFALAVPIVAVSVTWLTHWMNSQSLAHRRCTQGNTHEQYRYKDPNGYCGLGGAGISCPVGIAAA